MIWSWCGAVKKKRKTITIAIQIHVRASVVNDNDILYIDIKIEVGRVRNFTGYRIRVPGTGYSLF